MQHPFFAFGLPHGMEWFWIALIVILLFGADKLPKLARGLGKSLGEFKKAKEDFEKEIHSAASETDAKKIEDKNQIGGASTTPVNSATSVNDLTKKI